MAAALAAATLLSTGLLMASAGALFGGCNDQACNPTSLKSDMPSPALECPSGQLCYQGSCIRGCTAGQELSVDCTSNSDCSAPLGTCVNGKCSACEQGEVCVPTLNICQLSVQVPLPDSPNPPGSPNTLPYPLDAGPLDGGLSRNVDAGIEETPREIEVTYAGIVDLAQEEDYRGVSGNPTPGVAVNVSAWDVRGHGLGLKWRPEFSPPLIQCRDDDVDCGNRAAFELGQCVIRPLRSVTSTTSAGPAPVDLGVIRVSDHADFPGSIATQLVATFDPGIPGYGVVPATPPLNLLQLSQQPFDTFYLSVTGQTAPGITNGAWPNAGGGFLGHHVPFQLLPTEATKTLLRDATVTNPPTDDLVFQWDRVDTGSPQGEYVQVRLMGVNNELSCDAREGPNGEDTLRLVAATLTEWRTREGPGVYALYFERYSAQRLTIDGITDDVVVDFSVRVRHTLIGRLTIQ